MLRRAAAAQMTKSANFCDTARRNIAEHCVNTRRRANMEHRVFSNTSAEIWKKKKSLTLHEYIKINTWK